ncbi:hypothetical protein [Caminibacter pacificus]
MRGVIFLLLFSLLYARYSIELKPLKTFKSDIQTAEVIDGKVYFLTNTPNGKKFIVKNGKKIILYYYPKTQTIKFGKVTIKGKYIGAYPIEDRMIVFTNKAAYLINQNIIYKVVEFKDFNPEYVVKHQDKYLLVISGKDIKNGVFLFNSNLKANSGYFSDNIVRLYDGDIYVGYSRNIEYDIPDDFFNVNITSFGTYGNSNIKIKAVNYKLFLKKNGKVKTIKLPGKPDFIKSKGEDVYVYIDGVLYKYVYSSKKPLWNYKIKGLKDIVFLKKPILIVKNRAFILEEELTNPQKIELKTAFIAKIINADNPLVLTKKDKYTLTMFNKNLKIVWQKNFSAKINKMRYINGKIYLLGSKNNFFWIGVLDKNGKLLKEKSYFKNSQAYDIVKTKTGFLAVGYKFFDLLGKYTKRAVIVKLDKNLNELVNKTYLNTTSVATDILKYNDKYFVVASTQGNFPKIYFLIFDSNANHLDTFETTFEGIVSPIYYPEDKAIYFTETFSFWKDKVGIYKFKDDSYDVYRDFKIGEIEKILSPYCVIGNTKIISEDRVYGRVICHDDIWIDDFYLYGGIRINQVFYLIGKSEGKFFILKK